jgi:hypothetical protein
MKHCATDLQHGSNQSWRAENPFNYNSSNLYISPVQAGTVSLYESIECRVAAPQKASVSGELVSSVASKGFRQLGKFQLNR